MEQEQQTKTEQIGELVLLDKKLGEQTTDAFRRYQKGEITKEQLSMYRKVDRERRSYLKLYIEGFVDTILNEEQ